MENVHESANFRIMESKRWPRERPARTAHPLCELTFACFGLRRLTGSFKRRLKRLHYFILQLNNPLRGFCASIYSIFIPNQTMFSNSYGSFLGLVGLV